ncbi:cupin domain-containing protein [Candidatus Latescibacterota bacterium]
MPNTKVITVKDNVEYSDGSIVSKIILNKETGTVTLFAFDKGQKLSEHTAPFDALVHVVDGEAELIIGGEPMIVAEGQLAVMPADIPHAVNANKRFKMLLTMIKT